MDDRKEIQLAAYGKSSRRCSHLYRGPFRLLLFTELHEKERREIWPRKKTSRISPLKQRCSLRPRKILKRRPDKVWNKQRQWEMKRNTLVSAVQALGRADAGLLRLATAYTLARRDGEEAWAQKIGETKLEWNNLINIYDEKWFAAELVCNKELAAAMRAAAVEIRLTAQKMFSEKVDDYIALGKPIHEKIGKVRELVRSELGIESGPTV